MSSVSWARWLKSIESDRMEHHGFGGDSRPEEHSATELAWAGAPHQPLQNEHDGRRGHVAVIEQDVSRVNESFGRKSEPLLCRVKDGAAAGMNSPEVDRRECAARRDPGARLGASVTH